MGLVLGPLGPGAVSETGGVSGRVHMEDMGLTAGLKCDTCVLVSGSWTDLAGCTVAARVWVAMRGGKPSIAKASGSKAPPAPKRVLIIPLVLYDGSVNHCVVVAPAGPVPTGSRMR